MNASRSDPPTPRARAAARAAQRREQERAGLSNCQHRWPLCWQAA
jgi:hypothetical protein